MLSLDKIKYKNIFQYEKKLDKSLKLFIGLQSDDINFYYPFISYNKFDINKKKVLIGFKKVKLSIDHIKKHIFDKNKILLEKNNILYKKIQQKYKNCESYKIHYNYNRPFLVYITDNSVDIFIIPFDKYYLDKPYSDDKNYYVQLLKSYKPKQIFIGASPKNEMTIFSGGYGKTFLGNSILLKLEQKYVFIGQYIYEFTMNDEILNYYSPVGNNDVPYPLTIGKKYVYFMADNCYVSREIYDKCVNKDITNGYSYFYGDKGNCKFDFKKMNNLKIINEPSF